MAIDEGAMRRAGIKKIRVDAVGFIARGGLLRLANSRVIITGVQPERAVPTRDRSDRAHGEFDGDGMLRPASTVESARPRKYHPSQMTSQGIAFDSAFDATHRLRLDLAGIPGIGIEAARIEEARLARDAPATRGMFY